MQEKEYQLELIQGKNTYKFIQGMYRYVLTNRTKDIVVTLPAIAVIGFVPIQINPHYPTKPRPSFRFLKVLFIQVQSH